MTAVFAHGHNTDCADQGELGYSSQGFPQRGMEESSFGVCIENSTDGPVLKATRAEPVRGYAGVADILKTFGFPP